MSTNSTKAVVLGLILVVASVGATAMIGTVAAAPTPVNACTTIDSPGEYQLTADVANSGQNACIRVTSDDVMLDGNGHTLDGTGSGAGVQTAQQVENVTVENLMVTDWSRGIDYQETEEGDVSGVTASNNTIGIFVRGGSAGQIVDNQANENGLAGLWLASTNNQEVKNNDFSNNEKNGIHIRASSTNTLIGNQANHNGKHGVYVVSSTGNDFWKTNASNNALAGFRLFQSDNNRIRESVVHDNANGLVLTSSDNNYVEKPDEDGSERWSFWGAYEAGGTRITNITVGEDSGYATTFRSQTNDIQFRGINADEVPADPSGHTNIGKYVVAKNTTGDSAEASFLINVSYTDAEASGVNEDDLAVWVYSVTDGTWSEIPGSTVDTDKNYVRAYAKDFSNGKQIYAVLNTDSPESTSQSTSNQTPSEAGC